MKLQPSDDIRVKAEELFERSVALQELADYCTYLQHREKFVPAIMEVLREFLKNKPIDIPLDFDWLQQRVEECMTEKVSVDLELAKLAQVYDL